MKTPLNPTPSYEDDKEKLVQRIERFLLQYEKWHSKREKSLPTKLGPGLMQIYREARALLNHLVP